MESPSTTSTRLAEIARANVAEAPDSIEDAHPAATEAPDGKSAPASNYPCPHCRVILEVWTSDGWSGWRRCPACDQPLLPPDANPIPAAPWLAPGASSSRAKSLEFGMNSHLSEAKVEAAGRILDSTHVPFEPFGEAWQSRRTYIYRLVLKICLGLSLFGVLVYFLEQNNLALGFYCLVSLILFLLLMRPERRH